MHDHSMSGVEIITVTSYMVIGLGFVGHRVTNGKQAAILWPELLMSIFFLCGLTRALVFIGNPLGDTLTLIAHLALAVISQTYAFSQVLYLVWPELFDDNRVRPKLT